METPARHDGMNPVHVLSAQPYVLLVLAPAFWAGNMVASKLAVGEVDPYLFLLLRWTGGVVLLLPFVLDHLRADWGRIVPSLFWLGVYGALGFAGFNMLVYAAAHFTAGVNISIEQAAIPVMVLTGNFVVFRVRARALQVLGLILTVLGVVWVATHGEPARLLDLSVNLGDALVLLACLTYAIYSLTLRFKPDIHWLSFIFVTSAAALVASLVFLFAFGGGMATLIEQLPLTTPIGWACIGYVMLFPSIVAQLCYARGLQIVGPNRASIFINLLPVMGTILSVIILGEGLWPFHLVAAALVVIGIGLSEYAMPAKPRA